MAGLERRVRVSGREGEEVVWSRKAARRAGRLTNWLDDLNPSEDTIFPVEETCATVLRTLGAMCDDDWSASCLDECSPTQLATLIEGASNLLAEQALEYAQTAFACRLDGKCANELRELLGVVDDFESDEERVAALAEPAFMPDNPMPQLTAAAALPVNDDAAEAALGKVGVATLIELKGVNRAWRALGRRALCSRLCRREGHADPRQLHDITELNLELLIEAGRRWEAARAGRLLLHLERLTGYGFVVDVAAVRQVKLDDDGREEELESDEEEEEQLQIPLLRGPAKHALCSCVTGEGEPPLDLLVGAIACAGSGRIRGIRVQQLRADALANIDVHAENGIGPEGAILIASFIPVMGGLTSLNLSDNQLCGLDHHGRGTYTAEGITAIADALRINGGLTSLNLSDNQLCGLDHHGSGTYSAEGITAIADALRVNGGLTSIDVRQNSIAGDGAVQLAAAVLGNLNIKFFNEIPIKEMRANSLTELDLNGKYVGVEGGMVVAGLIPVMGALTVTNILGNQLDAESAKLLAEVAKQKGISLCGIQRDQTTADFRNKRLQPSDAILLASDLSQAVVTGSLTSLELRRNRLGDKGWGAIFAAICGNKDSKIMSLDAAAESIGPASVKLIAEALRTSVTGALTVTNLLGNQLDAESAKLLAEVAKQKGISLCGIQRDQTTADFSNQYLEPPDAILLASDLSQAVVTGALTVWCVLWGNMGPEGDALIHDAVRGKAGFELRL